MFNMYKFQDYQVNDMELKAQYYREFLKGDVETAQNIYKNNPQLQGKVVEKDGLNQLLNSILTLEGFYQDGVTQHLINELSRFQININEMMSMNEFSATIQYEINNFVVYNNIMYFCYEKPPIGTLPTNKNYFIELGLRGNQGNSSLGVNYRGVWNYVNNYLAKDMVVFNNDLYVAISNNINKNPSSQTSVWFKAVDMIPKIIYVSETEPIGLGRGDIWIQILN